MIAPKAAALHAMVSKTKALLDRAVALRQAGQWQEAVDLNAEVFRLSVTERCAEDLLEAVLADGICYRYMGHTELADEALNLALTIAELRGDGSRAARALNAVAALRQQNGDISDVDDVYLRARDLALSASDQLTAGQVSQNLGALASIRGDLADALSHCQVALQCYESIQHERSIAGLLNNMGMLYIDLRNFEMAQSCLDRALGISRSISDVVTEGIVHTNRTELFLGLGLLNEARESCDDAFEISSRLGDNRLKAEALKFYGVIYRESGRPHLAEIHLRQAVAVANKYQDILTEAEAERELALVFRALEKNRDALAALNRAHALFGDIKAKQDQADVNKRLTQLEDDFLALVRMWGESIEAKDRYTSGHCQRVADYACLIAERAGLSERDMVWFRMGAFLHDVGKTDIPGEILNKPGRLTDEERATIERHTVIGDEMLAPIPFPWDIRPMVRGHHERWDGRGYPDGLTGQEIHLTARILRIADIFDALTTTRSYREPLSAEQARQIMREDNGSFDPDVFAIFEDLYPQFEVMVAGVHAARMPRADHPANTPPA